jgi:NAD(P)-dependent dehydrogenase (short-subunit alcohol dehydrogenase family)
MKVPHNRVALVTGAARGIGAASAAALLADGWQVVYAGRQYTTLQQAIEATAEGESRAFAFAADVRDAASVASLFDAVRGRFGRLDFLFNNAGQFGPRNVRLEDLEVEQWREVVDTNLTGMFLCTREAFRLMKAQQPQGGRIVNNGSISAHAPRPDSVAYTATKHAVTGLTKSASLDGRRYNIAVGQIDIGNAATDMTQRMGAGTAQADGSIKPEPRMDVKHVADAIVQMANLPLDTNVQFMTIMATQMPFVGRG